MPQQKNQHFVPRCALKPFTVGGEGRAINVFHIRSRRSIERAPVKNQCSKDYFYGKDLSAEKILGRLEGQYARIIGLLVEGQQISADDESLLKLFTIVQTRRTERAIRELENLHRKLLDTTYIQHPTQRPPDMERQSLVALSMVTGLRLHPYILDLKFIVLKNRTHIDFITSDHPAVMTNRYSLDNLGDRRFGFGNSGLVLTMPLSPKLTAFFFDIGVYSVSIPRGSQYVDLKNSSDVEVLNQWQFLNAHQNLYFSSWDRRANVEALTTRDGISHSGEKPNVQALVLDESLPGKSYREGTETEIATVREQLIVAQFEHAVPFNWPAFLKFQRKMKIVDTHTAAGILRPAAVAMQIKEGRKVKYATES